MQNIAEKRAYKREYQRAWNERHKNDPRFRAQRRRYRQEARKRHPEKFRAKKQREKLRSYGLTEAQFLAALAEQGGLCAICRRLESDIDSQTGNLRRLSVDHDHYTGEFRGLLCGRCNKAIGLLGDDAQRAERVAEYLRKAAA